MESAATAGVRAGRMSGTRRRGHNRRAGAPGARGGGRGRRAAQEAATTSDLPPRARVPRCRPRCFSARWSCTRSCSRSCGACTARRARASSASTTTRRCSSRIEPCARSGTTSSGWSWRPTLATGIGLVLAVLAERVRWQTAFKVAVFMPMAISFLAAGVIFRIVYEEDPRRGLANAVVDRSGRHRAGRPGSTHARSPPTRKRCGPSTAPSPRPAASAPATPSRSGSSRSHRTRCPRTRSRHALRRCRTTAIGGVVWRDFTPGGGGERGVLDPEEQGLPGVHVDLVRGDDTVASATTDDRGAFVVARPRAGRVRRGAPVVELPRARHRTLAGSVPASSPRRSSLRSSGSGSGSR